MNDKVKALLKNYNQLFDKLLTLKHKYYDVELKLNEIRFGYKVGEDIEYKNIKGKVIGFYSSLWLVFRPYKKDGTLHKYKKIAYDLKPSFELD